MKTTAIISIVVVICCCMTFIQEAGPVDQSRTASTERIYDTDGIWLRDDATRDECVAAIREAIAMEWGDVEMNGEVSSIVLTDFEKKNPGVYVSADYYDLIKFSIYVNIDPSIRLLVKPNIQLRATYPLKKSITKQAAESACNEFNSEGAHAWCAFRSEDSRSDSDVIIFKTTIPVFEDYLPWREAMGLMTDQLRILGLAIATHSDMPPSQQLSIFKMLE
tara:strand:- start:224 stop:883 length:660 start_codon:yes stop_codon:yes gene_type:complete